VTCPYSEPNCAADVAADAPRCQCGRVLKRCSRCAARNRAFANFCRNCGSPLAPSRSNWSGYRGGSQRLGLNTAAVGPDCLTEKTDLLLTLGDPCRSLLGYDGHLVAISTAGAIHVADPLRPKNVSRFQAQGPITAEPCIRNGVLYLATRGQLTAYSLAATTMAPPRVKPLWQLPLNGTPVQALTVTGNRLYVTVASADWRAVHVIEDLDQSQPAISGALHGATKVSWVAAHPAGHRAVFLSETEGRGVQLHVAEQKLTSRPVPLDGLAEHPIAFLGGTVFAIFGDSRRLYRIDAASGSIEEPLDEDTQLFALSHDVDDEWDRDGVWINGDGIYFSRSGVRDAFQPHERAMKGSLLIVRGSAVAVGMEDGRVRIYNMARLPRHEVWHVGGSRNADAITALASFDHWIAAGNRVGVVEVRSVRAARAGA
jgi:hypothetical protein